MGKLQLVRGFAGICTDAALPLYSAASVLSRVLHIFERILTLSILSAIHHMFSQPGSQPASQAEQCLGQPASQPASQTEQCLGQPASQPANQSSTRQWVLAFVSGLDCGAKGLGFRVYALDKQA